MAVETTEARRLSPQEKREVAAEASCDPRTVDAYLAGRSQVSTVRRRIARALVALGFASTSEPRAAA